MILAICVSKTLLAKHWPSSWQEGHGAERADELPDVTAVWEPMGKLCEPREGRPPMEFPLVEPIEVRSER